MIRHRMIPSQSIGTLVCLLVAIGCPFASGQDLPTVSLSPSTKLVFADEDLGRTQIAKVDAFVSKLQPLERQIRMGTEEPVSADAYLQSLQAGVKNWSEEDVKKLKTATAKVRTALAQYALPFPETINLIRVSSDVEGNAPHCRGANVIVPDGFFNIPRPETVLAHELFHVLSSHNRELRDELYSIIGFKRCAEVELPGDLLTRRLTNPDAPTHEHFVNIEKDGRELMVIPITFTISSEYRPGGLFSQLQFQFLELEQVDGKVQPKLDGGRPVLVEPRNLPGYLKKIGSNTRYIIHPEETLADNFWILVLNPSQAKDRWVLEAMDKVLKAQK